MDRLMQFTVHGTSLTVETCQDDAKAFAIHVLQRKQLRKWRFTHCERGSANPTQPRPT